MEADVALLGGTAVLEVAKDVGVEDHTAGTGTEVVAYLIPSVGGPIAGAGALDHVDPQPCKLLGLRAVHPWHQLAVLDREVASAVVHQTGEVAGVDGGPAA